MAAMMIPGGQLAGVGLMVAGAISSGFDKAAEDEKKRLEKIKEIRIKNATVYQENTMEARKGVANLVSQGLDIGTATDLYNRQTAAAKTAFTGNITQGASESDEDFKKRKEDTASQVTDVFNQSGLFKGVKGAEKTIKLMDQFKNLTAAGGIYENNATGLAEQLVKIQGEGYTVGEGKNKKTYKGQAAIDAFYQQSGAATQGGLGFDKSGTVPTYLPNAPAFNAGTAALQGQTISAEDMKLLTSAITQFDNLEIGLSGNIVGYKNGSTVQTALGEDSLGMSEGAAAIFRNLFNSGNAPKLATGGIDVAALPGYLQTTNAARQTTLLNAANALNPLTGNKTLAIADDNKLVVVTKETATKTDKQNQENADRHLLALKDIKTSVSESAKKPVTVTLKVTDANGKPINVQAVPNG
jgi:hypothetical protein